jgi:hypothetical protein
MYRTKYLRETQLRLVRLPSNSPPPLKQQHQHSTLFVALEHLVKIYEANMKNHHCDDFYSPPFPTLLDPYPSLLTYLNILFRHGGVTCTGAYKEETFL